MRRDDEIDDTSTSLTQDSSSRLQLVPVRPAGRLPVLPPVGYTWTCVPPTQLPASIGYPQAVPSAYVYPTSNYGHVFSPLVAPPANNVYPSSMLPLPIAYPTLDPASAFQIQKVPRQRKDVLTVDPKMMQDLCDELVHVDVTAFVREIVNGCIEDIVRRYLREVHLLSAYSHHKPYLQPRPHSYQEQVQRHLSRPRVLTSRREHAQTEVRYSEVQQKMIACSNYSQLSRCVCDVLASEEMFAQLLTCHFAGSSGHLRIITQAHVHRVLKELMMEHLLKLLVSQ